MGLFDSLTGANKESPEARARREASQESLKRGGLPLNAVDRLREQASRQNTPSHLWTGDLSAGEFSLVNQAGYEPLGQVMGSSVYHVGWQWNRTTNWQNNSWGQGSSYELDVVTRAFYQARHLALGRLQQEAALLHATGVVGVRLEHKEYEWGADMIEFAAIGTAIRERDVAPNASGMSTHVRLSELSGQDFWLLRQSGFRPMGIAVGNCTWYQQPSWNTQNVTQGGFFSGSWQNQELPDYTQALYNAREMAMERMENEARSANATGIVSVTVDVDVEPQHVEDSNHQTRIDMIYHFTAIGTSIAPFPAPPNATRALSLAVSLK